MKPVSVDTDYHESPAKAMEIVQYCQQYSIGQAAMKYRLRYTTVWQLYKHQLVIKQQVDAAGGKLIGTFLNK